MTSFSTDIFHCVTSESTVYQTTQFWASAVCVNRPSCCYIGKTKILLLLSEKKEYIYIHTHTQGAPKVGIWCILDGIMVIFNIEVLNNSLLFITFDIGKCYKVLSQC